MVNFTIENYINRYSCRVIVFCHNESPSDFDIKWYLEKYHKTCTLEIIKISDILDRNIDDIFDSITHCNNFYITTDSRRIRNAIRNKIRDKLGIDIHIRKYSKIVRYVNIISWRK